MSILLVISLIFVFAIQCYLLYLILFKEPNIIRKYKEVKYKYDICKNKVYIYKVILKENINYKDKYLKEINNNKELKNKINKLYKIIKDKDNKLYKQYR